MSISLTGDKELLTKLDNLQRKDARAAGRKGARAGCKRILPAAKAAFPRRTGLSAKSFKVRSMRRSRKSYGSKVTIGQGSFPKAFYAKFVEWGHYAGKRAAGTSHKAGQSNAQGRHWVPGVFSIKHAADNQAHAALNEAVFVMQQEIVKRMKI